MAAAPRFLVGIHYWPRGKGPDFWKAFEPEEIAADFDVIKSLGAGAVCLPLMWEDFQPQPDLMSPMALRHLDQVFDLAAACGLKLLPALFTGYHSGVGWLPEWVLGDDEDPGDPQPRRVSLGRHTRRKVRNLYTDPAMLQAQVGLVRTVVPRYRRHQALFGWSVGTELGRVREPENSREVWLWNALVAGETKRLDPRHPALYTLGAEDLLRDRIRPADVAEPEDLVGVRCRDMGPEPEEVVFVADLAGHLAGRRVLAMEVGRPTAPRGMESRFDDYHEGQAHRTAYMLSEEAAADYLIAALSGLHAAGALGAFVYSFADAEPVLFGRAPFDERPPERSFGLLRADGTEKPAAEALRRFTRKRRAVVDGDAARMADLEPEAYYRSPGEAFRVRLADYLG